MGVAITWRTGHPGTDELFDDAVAHFTRAGAVLIEVAAAMPGPAEGDDELTVLLAEMADDLGAYLAARPGEGARSLAELVAFNEAHASDELGAFGQEHFTAALALGGRRSPTYAEARRRNLDWALRTCLGPALAGVDVLVAPAYAPAWKSDLLLGDRPEGASPVTTAPAICGWPVATVPMGLVGGLPVGLSLVGRPGSEGLLLACAQAVEDGAGLLATRRRRRRGAAVVWLCSCRQSVGAPLPASSIGGGWTPSIAWKVRCGPSSPSTGVVSRSTTIVSPTRNSFHKIRSESGSSTSCWMARRSGRAPSCGS